MVYECCFRRALRRVEEGLYRAGLESPRLREGIAKSAYKGTELRQLLWRGGVVDAVQGWHTKPGQVCSHGAIGQQHTLLDQRVCSGALDAHNSVDPALTVEDDVSFGQVEVETPRGQALLM